MQMAIPRAVWLGVVVSLAAVVSASADDDAGFQPIFDGKTLKGWDGDPRFWRVEDGAITGETTPDNPTQGNTFIVWTDGQVDDFELKLEYRITGHNSGIQYRSFHLPGAKDRWRIGGYQADLEAGDQWSGTNYGERFRGILAKRGEKTIIGEDHKPRVVGTFGDPKVLQSFIRKNDWNEYHIIARGYRFIHKINGHVMSEVIDEDTGMRRRSGLIALQLHAGPPMKVQFRNIRLKRLKMADKRKVVFVAGTRSHGYGAHEHAAGCRLLADALNENVPAVLAVVYRNGWPADPTAFDNADAVVFYCDGGGRHPVLRHLDTMERLMRRGTGLVCIHYAVEVPKGEPGERFLDWLGGYFEPFWSVNPHWTAHFRNLPEHPITRGVKPFSINDEWYYHMRFRDKPPAITPILTDLPPRETLNRPDGHHSNNPFVRKAVLEEKQPQHVAWAFERENGGRSFGFTGGHVHWNWGHDQFRKLVLNAIVWASGAEVPSEGVQSPPLSLADLRAHQDFDPPKNFDFGRIEALLAGWRSETQTAAP